MSRQNRCGWRCCKSNGHSLRPISTIYAPAQNSNRSMLAAFQLPSQDVHPRGCLLVSLPSIWQARASFFANQSWIESPGSLGALNIAEGIPNPQIRLAKVWFRWQYTKRVRQPNDMLLSMQVFNRKPQPTSMGPRLSDRFDQLMWCSRWAPRFWTRSWGTATARSPWRNCSRSSGDQCRCESGGLRVFLVNQSESPESKP